MNHIIARFGAIDIAEQMTAAYNACLYVWLMYMNAAAGIHKRIHTCRSNDRINNHASWQRITMQSHRFACLTLQLNCYSAQTCHEFSCRFALCLQRFTFFAQPRAPTVSMKRTLLFASIPNKTKTLRHPN